MLLICRQCHLVQVPGVEADDVIGTMAYRAVQVRPASELHGVVVTAWCGEATSMLECILQLQVPPSDWSLKPDCVVPFI